MPGRQFTPSLPLRGRIFPYYETDTSPTLPGASPATGLGGRHFLARLRPVQRSALVPSGPCEPAAPFALRRRSCCGRIVLCFSPLGTVLFGAPLSVVESN